MTFPKNTDPLKKLGKLNSTFYFKQFKVEDGRSTMKVGTDAVLLGAVAQVEHVGNILEIGTGSGVISLILAQRSHALIDAIEIDEDSASQATNNVQTSPWKGRIIIIHCPLQDFVQKAGKKYDLVISNPPYFSRSLKSVCEKRNISRHDDLLSFDELISGSSALMLPDASLWVILPFNESREFMEKSRDSGLFVHYHLNIATKNGNECQLVILQLKKSTPKKSQEYLLAIKNPDNFFTKEYIELTKEFYIDF